MTPEEARALLDGATPGPWRVDPHHPGDVLSPENHWLAGTYETGAGFTDAALISAAPTLAAMIAGMREEWVGQYLVHEGEWATVCVYPTHEEVARHLDLKGWDAYTRTRIARRYVTEPEAADAVD